MENIYNIDADKFEWLKGIGAKQFKTPMVMSMAHGTYLLSIEHINNTPLDELRDNYDNSVNAHMHHQHLDRENMCTVTLDGVTTQSDDFVAVLAKPNGDASITYNTDTLTMGMAMKMVAKSFIECMDECTEEERAEITEVLGTAFIGDYQYE